MITISLILMVLLVSGCAAITEDPWGWLEDPEQQYWSEIVINGHGREIRFSVPDRLKAGGEHLRYWPELENNKRDLLVNIPAESLYEQAHRAAQFIWDRNWGGFYKKGDFDFSLNVWIFYEGDETELLDLTIEQRLERQMKQYEEIYSKSDSIWRDYFFDHYWAKPFLSDQSHTWIVENQPQITADHQYFYISISDVHELKFSFYISGVGERFGGPEDPEWRKRRWELVEKIMHSVQITPAPYTN